MPCLKAYILPKINSYQPLQNSVTTEYDIYYDNKL